MVVATFTLQPREPQCKNRRHKLNLRGHKLDPVPGPNLGLWEGCVGNSIQWKISVRLYMDLCVVVK